MLDTISLCSSWITYWAWKKPKSIYILLKPKPIQSLSDFLKAKAQACQIKIYKARHLNPVHFVTSHKVTPGIVFIYFIFL